MSKSKSIIHYSLFFIHGLKSIIHYSSFIILCWKRFSKKQRIYIFTGLTALILILIPAALYIASNIKPAEAAWWNDSWGYRQTVNITSSTALTDFQVSIATDTATLISQGKMKNDCSDIRITDQNGKLLPYWIEEGSAPCNTTSTKIWTKIPSVYSSGNTIYIYYGNPSATPVQDGNKVFEYFSDFNSSVLDPIFTEADSPAEITLSGGKLVFTGGTSGSWDQGVYLKNAIARGDMTMEFDYQWTSGNASYDAFMFGWKDDGTGKSYTNLVYGYYNVSSDSCTTCAVSLYEDGNIRGGLTGNWIQNTNYKVRVRMRSSGGAYYDQSSDGGINWTNSYTSTYSTESNLHPAWMLHSGTHNIDNFFVRKDAPTPPSAASPTNEEKSPGPVAYWKFDEGYGSNTYDSTSNKNNGTITGATWQSEDQCISGKCLIFDGSDDKVTIANTNNRIIPASNAAFSISMWVKPNDLTTATTKSLVTNETYNVSGFRMGTDPQGQLNFWSSESGGTANVNGVRVLSVNQWYHIEIVYDGSTVTSYINGVQDATDATSTVVSNTNTINIATAIGGKQWWKGFIDEPKIYNYARSAAQVKTDYSSRGSKSGSSVSIGSSVPFLSNGLVGYWKMDESSGAGSALTDSSGNGNNGAAVLWGGGNTATDSAHVAGKFGNSFSFDHVDDYLKMPSSVSNNIGNLITISSWVYANPFQESSVARGIVCDEYGVGDSNVEFGIYLNGGHVLTSGFHDGSWHSVSDSNAFPTGRWVHVAATYDGHFIKIYQDGQLIKTSSDFNLPLPSGTTGWRIGRRWDLGNPGDLWNGYIDETRIYNRALSPAEVQKLYNWAPGPIAYYNFEEGSGSTLFDISGNGNNSDAFGGNPTWTTGKYGKALNFDTNSYARKNSFSMGSDPVFTVSGWFKRTGSMLNTGAWGIGAGGTSQQTISGFNNSGQKIGIDLWGTSTYYVNDDYPLNEWVYVTWVKTSSQFTPSTIKIYVNGIEKPLNISRDGADTVNLSSGLTVGAIYNSSTYNAPVIVDYIKIYNYARTPGQIVEDMNAGHPIGGSPVASQLGYWKLDEGYGITANNSGNAGATLNGIISGATWTNDGKIGKALSLNSSYVSFGDVSAVETGPVTFTTWARFNNNTGDHDLFTKGIHSTSQSLVIWRDETVGSGPDTGNTNTLSVLVYDGTNQDWYAAPSGSLNDTAWHYIAVTLNPGVEMKIYIDGVLKRTGAMTSSGIQNTTNALRIGADINGSVPLNGTMDEVKIYNSALTADQVKLDMNQGKSLVLGSLSDTSGLAGGSVASTSASAQYCVPGDTVTCNSPVTEWNFEEGQGGTVNDTSGNGNEGTWSGLGSHWISGKFGKAGNFTGNTAKDYVYKIPSQTVSNNFTVSVWVKPTSTQNMTVFSTRLPNEYTFDLQLNGGTTIHGDIGNGSSWITVSANATYNYPLNKWTHITYTVTTTGYKIYVNGQQMASNSYAITSPLLFDLNHRIQIGSHYSGTGSTYYFQGQIDQARIYNYERTPAQVAWDYNQGKPVGHWKFDECQGTTAYDSSGNSNHGTITIGATVPQTTAGTCTSPTDGTGAWYNGRTGKYNSSLKFDGADDQVSIGDPVSGIYDFGTSNFSLSAWIKTTDNGQAIVAKQVPNIASSWNGFNFWISTEGKLQPTVDWSTNGSFGNIVSNTSVNDGGWKHVVFVMNGSDRTNWKIYINGNSDSFTESGVDLTGSGINNSTSLRIGNRDYAGGFFNGQIDDVRIYNYALTATQVKNVMNQGAAVRYGPSQGSP